MATIRQRGNTWNVYWRAGRAGRTESTTWTSESLALQAKTIAEAHRHRITGDDVYTAVVGPALASELETSDLPTLAEYADTWLGSKNRISPAQRARYRRQLDIRILPALGHLHLDQITGTDIGTFLAALRREVKDSTATRYYACLHGLLGMAAADRLIPDNPARRTDFVRDLVRHDDTGEEAVYLTPPQIEHLCAGMTGPAADVVRLLVGTGCRWSELTAVPVSEVDLLAKPATMRVRQAWKKDGRRWYLGPTKGRRKRTLPIGAALVDLLATVTAGEPGDAMVAAVAMREHGRPFLAVEDDGIRLDYHAYRSHHWDPAVKIATAGDHPARLTARPTIHDLRHTHAAWLISAGVPLPEVQRRLGHQQITTTIETYGGLMPEVSTATIAALDAVMPPSNAPEGSAASNHAR